MWCGKLNTSELEGEKNMKVQETAGCKLELEKIYITISKGSQRTAYMRRVFCMRLTKEVEIRSLRRNLKKRSLRRKLK